MESPVDPLFRVHVLAATPEPERLIWLAMHQDYSEQFVALERPAEVIGDPVRHLLEGNRGHYGPLEHPQITFNVGYFPHSVMQQARTHRIGVSFDVQSMRYTGQRIAKAANGELPIEEVFYLRPPGRYRDRQGKDYEYTDSQRKDDLRACQEAALRYSDRLEEGFSEEQAREMIPYAIRQHFVVSFNLRSALHFLDLRSKRDAQLEIQQLCHLMLPHLQGWAPRIVDWYSNSRLHRAQLAP